MADELTDPTLAAIAAALQGCPGDEFKARLRRRLERSIETMLTTPAPAAAVRRVTPFVMTQDVDAFVAFATRVFGAAEVQRAIRPAGGVHCELRIGDSTLRVRGATPEPIAPRLLGLHVYVDDVDAVFARALAEGARSLGEPADRPYGERAGFVTDPAGNQWYIATPLGPSYFTGHRHTVIPHLYVQQMPARTAADFIAFLELAFGAQVELRHDAGDRVAHAVLRLGDTAVELGEGLDAPGIPAPAAFVVSADDADAMYAQALAAGAEPLFPPEPRPFGRVGGVRDAWGNEWHITAP